MSPSAPGPPGVPLRSVIMFPLPILLLACPAVAASSPGQDPRPEVRPVVAADIPAPDGRWSWGPDFAPQVNLYGNLIARKERKAIYDDDGNEVSDIARIRQVDVIFSTPLAPRIDTLIAASVQSNAANSEFNIEFEQAYVRFGTLPVVGEVPHGVTFSIGQFRPKFGRLNRERLYDLPQLNRPRALTQFFGENGYSQTGVSGTYSTPASAYGSLRLDAEYLDSGSPPLTIDDGGATGGNNLRLSWFSPVEASHGFEIGASQLNTRRADQDGRRSQVSGFDALYSWRPQPEQRPRLWLGGEWLFGEIDPTPSSTQEPGGFYAWMLTRINDHWYAGARYDLSEELDNDSLQTQTISLYATFMTNEHVRIQLAIERSQSDIALNDDVTRVLVELNFNAGTGPDTPFWLR